MDGGDGRFGAIPKLNHKIKVCFEHRAPLLGGGVALLGEFFQIKTSAKRRAVGCQHNRANIRIRTKRL